MSSYPGSGVSPKDIFGFAAIADPDSPHSPNPFYDSAEEQTRAFGSSGMLLNPPPLALDLDEPPGDHSSAPPDFCDWRLASSDSGALPRLFDGLELDSASASELSVDAGPPPPLTSTASLPTLSLGGPNGHTFYNASAPPRHPLSSSAGHEDSVAPSAGHAAAFGDHRPATAAAAAAAKAPPAHHSHPYALAHLDKRHSLSDSNLTAGPLHNRIAASFGFEATAGASRRLGGAARGRSHSTATSPRDSSSASSPYTSPRDGVDAPATNGNSNGNETIFSRRDAFIQPMKKKPRSRPSSLTFVTTADDDMDAPPMQSAGRGMTVTLKRSGSLHHQPGAFTASGDFDDSDLDDSPPVRPLVRPVRRHSATQLATSTSSTSFAAAAAAAATAAAANGSMGSTASASVVQAVLDQLTQDIAVPAQNFTLAAQPKDKQRKSYKNENRYIAPNPLAVHYVGPPPFVGATVDVVLTNDSGAPLALERQFDLVGERRVRCDANGVAQFSLKMHDTSRGEYIRLCFVAQLDDATRPPEFFLTSGFRVDTNIRKASAAAKNAAAANSANDARAKIQQSLESSA